jgi:hypothetical protein
VDNTFLPTKAYGVAMPIIKIVGQKHKHHKAKLKALLDTSKETGPEAKAGNFISRHQTVRRTIAV